MFKSTALIAALLTCVAIAPAQATSVENGLRINGMKANGVRLNGPILQGISMQGISMQGISMQGIRLNGLKVNGVDLGPTAEAMRLIAIELPR